MKSAITNYMYARKFARAPICMHTASYYLLLQRGFPLSTFPDIVWVDVDPGHWSEKDTVW